MNLHLTPTRRNAPAKKVPQPIDIAVGARVRFIRQHQQMSQSDLGDRLGITFQQIQKYEKGTNRIGSSRLAQIAEVFGVPVATLFDTVPQNLGEAPEQFSATEMRMIRALRRLPSGAASNFVNMIEAFQNESK